MGATVTKSAYLDRRDYQLASRSNFLSANEISPDQHSLDQTNSTQSKQKAANIKKSSFAFPQISFFQGKSNTFVSKKNSRTNLAKSSNKPSLNSSKSRQKEHQYKFSTHQASQIADTSVNFNDLEFDSDDQLSDGDSNSQQFTYIVDSESQHSSLEKFSSSKEISNFKQSKIIIRNSTNNPKLAAYISNYLQERDFLNIEIANDEIYQGSTSQQGLTTIRTDGQNLKSATYLKNILGFGNLELLPSEFLNASDSSELIILLGDDAQVFSQNQDFVRFIR